MSMEAPKCLSAAAHASGDVPYKQMSRESGSGPW